MFQIRTIIVATCAVLSANFPAMAQMGAATSYGAACGPSPAVVIDGETYRLTRMPAARGYIGGPVGYSVNLSGAPSVQPAYQPAPVAVRPPAQAGAYRPIPTAAYGVVGADGGSFFGSYVVSELRTDAGIVSGAALSGLTVDMRLDGRIGGNGGCNDFSGVWRVDQGRVSVSNLSATERACFAPAPYERALLQALRGAEFISDDGLTVQLRDAGRRLLLSLKRDGTAHGL